MEQLKPQTSHSVDTAESDQNDESISPADGMNQKCNEDEDAEFAMNSLANRFIHQISVPYLIKNFESIDIKPKLVQNQTTVTEKIMNQTQLNAAHVDRLTEKFEQCKAPVHSHLEKFKQYKIEYAHVDRLTKKFEQHKVKLKESMNFSHVDVLPVRSHLEKFQRYKIEHGKITNVSNQDDSLVSSQSEKCENKIWKQVNQDDSPVCSSSHQEKFQQYKIAHEEISKVAEPDDKIWNQVEQNDSLETQQMEQFELCTSQDEKIVLKQADQDATFFMSPEMKKFEIYKGQNKGQDDMIDLKQTDQDDAVVSTQMKKSVLYRDQGSKIWKGADQDATFLVSPKMQKVEQNKGQDDMIDLKQTDQDDAVVSTQMKKSVLYRDQDSKIWKRADQDAAFLVSSEVQKFEQNKGRDELIDLEQTDQDDAVVSTQMKKSVLYRDQDSKIWKRADQDAAFLVSSEVQKFEQNKGRDELIDLKQTDQDDAVVSTQMKKSVLYQDQDSKIWKRADQDATFLMSPKMQKFEQNNMIDLKQADQDDAVVSTQMKKSVLYWDQDSKIWKRADQDATFLVSPEMQKFEQNKGQDDMIDQKQTDQDDAVVSTQMKKSVLYRDQDSKIWKMADQDTFLASPLTGNSDLFKIDHDQILSSAHQDVYLMNSTEKFEMPQKENCIVEQTPQEKQCHFYLTNKSSNPKVSSVPHIFPIVNVVPFSSIPVHEHSWSRPSLHSQIDQDLESVKKYPIHVDKNMIFALVQKVVYEDTSLFLAELIANASDALTQSKYTFGRKLGSLENELFIRIAPNRQSGTLTIYDSGIGMSKDDMIRYLCVLGASGTKEFQKALPSDTLVRTKGRYGLGFFSVFNVADKVTVVSKKLNEHQCVIHFKCPMKSFSVGFDHGLSIGHGTKVILHLNLRQIEYLDRSRIYELVRRDSMDIKFPIKLLTDEGCPTVGTPVAMNASSPGVMSPSSHRPVWTERLESHHHHPHSDGSCRCYMDPSLERLIMDIARNEVDKGMDKVVKKLDEQKGRFLDTIFGGRLSVDHSTQDHLCDIITNTGLPSISCKTSIQS